MKKIKLNIGCGIHHFNGFINIDKYLTKDFLQAEVKAKKPTAVNVVIEKGSKYVQADVADLPFPNDYADYIESVDMIEHIPMRDFEKAIREMYRVLKPGCTMKLFTVNFNELAKEWLEAIEGKPFDSQVYLDISETIYGNQLNEGNFHTIPITPEMMKEVLMYAGFTKIMMATYPRGCPDFPELETQKKTEGAVLRSGALYIEATK